MSEREALKLLAEAEKKSKQPTGFASWFGSNTLDEAADLYSRAGNTFKIIKKCESSTRLLYCYR
jgi:hypothetical protein